MTKGGIIGGTAIGAAGLGTGGLVGHSLTKTAEPEGVNNDKFKKFSEHETDFDIYLREKNNFHAGRQIKNFFLKNYAKERRGQMPLYYAHEDDMRKHLEEVIGLDGKKVVNVDMRVETLQPEAKNKVVDSRRE